MESITLQTNDSIVSSGDLLGQLQFAASAESDGGASQLVVGRIYSQAEGAFSASSNPASIIFATSASDALPASGKIKIDQDGNILPLEHYQYSIGSSGLAFKDLYAGSGYFNSLKVNGIDVSISGHTHTASQITDFNEAVDDRIGSGLLVGGTGVIFYYNDASGSLTLNNLHTEANILSQEPQGFVSRTGSIISFNDSTRTFTIQPAISGTTYDVYVKGIKVPKTGVETVIIDTGSALNYLHFSTTPPYSLETKTTSFDFTEDVPIAYIHWNSDIGQSTFFGEERHGIKMDTTTHRWINDTFGIQYINGLSISNYTLLGDGSSNSHAQFSIADGTLYQEDIIINITNGTGNIEFYQQLSPTGYIPVYYHSGTTGQWVRDPATAFALKYNGTGPLYNLYSPGPPPNWSIPNVGDNKFFAMWIVATNDINDPILAIMGQREDSNLGTAENNNNWSDVNLTNVPTDEIKPLYRLIFQADTAFTNTPKASLQSILDIRLSVLTTVAGVTQNDHGSLFGLGDDDHTQYVHINTARTINATHTFQNGITFDGSGTQYIAYVPSNVNITGGSGNFNSLSINNTGVPVGSGLTHYVAKWSGTNVLTTGLLYDNGINVAVGTGSPKAQFHVSRTLNNSSILRVEGTYFQGNLEFYETGSLRGTIGYGDAGALFPNQITDSLAILGTNALHLGAGTGASNAGITIRSTGNVGVGTNNPTVKFQVESGNITFNDDAGDYDFRVEGDNDTNLLFTDASTDRVGIGTNTPSYKLHVVGTGYITGDVIVDGNVTVNGTTTTVNVDRMEVEDPILTLGLASGNIVSNTSLDRGLALIISTGLTAFMGWDQSLSEFSLLSSGVATSNSGIYSPGTYGNLHAAAFIGTSGNFSSNVTVGGSLTINGTGVPVGSGTANHIAYWSDVGVITSDSGQLYWDATNHKLGIGTALPTGSLHVNGSGFIGGTGVAPAATLHVYSNVSGNTIFNAEGTNGSLFSVVDNLSGVLMSVNTIAGLPVFQVNSDYSISGGRFNQSDFVITSGGRVGIGTGSPREKLDVRGNAFVSGNIQLADTTGTAGHRFQFYRGGGAVYDYTISKEGNNLAISTANDSGTIRYTQFGYHSGSTWTPQVVVNNYNGGIGVRTTSPSYQLHVNGSGFFASGLVVNGALTVNGTGVVTGIGTSGYLAKWNSSGGITSGIIYESGANVGIGTISPTYKLQVNGSFGATTKSFNIVHPSKPGYRLEYGSLESPYHGVRLTGKDVVVNGQSIVQLPDYIKDLIHDEDLNIQLTNYKHGKVLYVDDIDLENNQFIVKCNSWFSNNLEFFWTFSAVRKDVERLIVERKE